MKASDLIYDWNTALPLNLIPKGPVLLNDETLPRSCFDRPFRFGCFVEAALLFVFFKTHEKCEPDRAKRSKRSEMD